MSAYYDLDYKKMMLRIGTIFPQKESLTIGGCKFTFKDEYLFVAKNTYAGTIEMATYFLGLPCSEKIATEIEANANNLIVYVYFKVPNMDVVINFQDMKRYGSMPNLSVKVDKIELKNRMTSKSYIIAK